MVEEPVNPETVVDLDQLDQPMEEETKSVEKEMPEPLTEQKPLMNEDLRVEEEPNPEAVLNRSKTNQSEDRPSPLKNYQNIHRKASQ